MQNSWGRGNGEGDKQGLQINKKLFAGKSYPGWTYFASNYDLNHSTRPITKNSLSLSLPKGALDAW